MAGGERNGAEVPKGVLMAKGIQKQPSKTSERVDKDLPDVRTCHKKEQGGDE